MPHSCGTTLPDDAEISSPQAVAILGRHPSTRAVMKEIVEVETVDAYLRLAALVLLATGACLLVVGGLAKGRLAFWARRASAVGLAGPIVFGMWRLYSYLVRYDPKSGYFGLQSVKVLLLCILLFVVVGALLGIGAAFLTSCGKHRKV